ncbi:MAG: glycoside hydrolase family 43 protein [Jatrophihabitantaceae bacterium]
MIRRAVALPLLFVALTAAGCGGGSAGSAHPSPAGSTSADGYVNPVYRSDFPDPAVLRVGTQYHAYGTQGGSKNIQTLTSADLVHWRAGPDALPDVGRWASTGSTWAPEVLALESRYAMYYVAHDTASGKQCIGRATASEPAGPFTDASARPLVCQPTLGGSIDPNPVRLADGSLYLYWKNDGNCCGQPVQLWGQRLSPDGSGLVGTPVALLRNTKPWQGSLIEAPEMVARPGHYTLFYSANDYASDRYGIGYADCRGPLGPCTDAADASLIASNDFAAGPGHCFVLQSPDGDWWMLYHAWPPSAIGAQDPGRLLWLEPVSWQGGTPSVHSSDVAPQPVPR